MSKNNGNSNPEDFFPIKYEDSMDLNTLLKQTKNLVKNSDNYNAYITKYTNKIQITSFKLPQVSSYPILVNTELIPHGRANGSVLKEKDLHNKNANFSLLSIIDHPRSESVKISNSKNSIFQKEYSHVQQQSVRELSLIKNNNNRPSFMSMKYVMNSDKKETHSFSWDLNQYLNEIDIFVKEPYLDLEYNNKMIFNNFEFHFNTIKSKLEYYKENKNENHTTRLIKKINPGTEKEIILKLSSIKIIFKNLTDTNKRLKKFFIPLSLVIMFYCGDLDFIKFLVLSIFRFNEDYDSLNLEESEIKKILQTSKVFQFDDNETKMTKDRNFLFRKYRDNIYKFYWITPIYIYEIEIK